jgi:hypothetical protein
MRSRVIEVEEAAGLMPLIGTLQARGLAQIAAMKISLPVSWRAMGNLGGALAEK